MKRTVPTRALRARANLDQLKRQAKELLAAFQAGDPAAVSEVRAHYGEAGPAGFALHDAQLVLARAHGFESWPKLKAYLDGVTARHLCDAVERGDVAGVRALLRRRPEIVNLERPGHGEQRAIHIAVLRRDQAMVRLLMENGADARRGIWPNRDATSAQTIAAERGYHELVAVIEDIERRRPDPDQPVSPPIVPDSGELSEAVRRDDAAEVRRLLDLGFDPDERSRVEGTDDVGYSWGLPLYLCARSGKLVIAELLLARGADPNGQVMASGSPTYMAYVRKDQAMIQLLESHGGVLDAASVGYLRQTEIARRMLAGELDPHLETGKFSGENVSEQLLWSGASGGDAGIVRMSLARIDRPRDDPRWFWMLWRPLPGHSIRPEAERPLFQECFRLILQRCDPNLRAPSFGQTMLHEVIARDHEEGVAFATLLLDAGARTDIRDHLLQSTPLGWACRWGRAALARLLLARGADPVEAEAESWATPRAWAGKMGHDGLLP